MLELLCLIVCLVILFGLSSLTWLHYAADFKRYVFARRVQAALIYARAQAIKLHKAVRYCGSSDGETCDGNWLSGQLIQVVDGGRVLKFYQCCKTEDFLSFSANFGRNHAVEFLATGSTNGQQGHFSLCNLPDQNLLRHCTWVKVHFSGQVQINEQRFSD